MTCTSILCRWDREPALSVGLSLSLSTRAALGRAHVVASNCPIGAGVGTAERGLGGVRRWKGADGDSSHTCSPLHQSPSRKCCSVHAWSRSLEAYPPGKAASGSAYYWDSFYCYSTSPCLALSCLRRLPSQHDGDGAAVELHSSCLVHWWASDGLAAGH